MKYILDYMKYKGVECAVSEGVRLGSEGGVDLAQKVLKVLAEQPAHFKHSYDLSLSPEEKIEKLATGLYGADGVVFQEQAKQDLEMIHRLKLDNLPVNIAKTPYSFSDDAKLKGAPTGWKLKIREIHPHTGAGYLVALAGKMMLMPGLPDNPMLENMDLTDDGQARGLF